MISLVMWIVLFFVFCNLVSGASQNGTYCIKSFEGRDFYIPNSLLDYTYFGYKELVFSYSTYLCDTERECAVEQATIYKTRNALVRCIGYHHSTISSLRSPFSSNTGYQLRYTGASNNGYSTTIINVVCSTAIMTSFTFVYAGPNNFYFVLHIPMTMCSNGTVSGNGVLNAASGFVSDPMCVKVHNNIAYDIPSYFHMNTYYGNISIRDYSYQMMLCRTTDTTRWLEPGLQNCSIVQKLLGDYENNCIGSLWSSNQYDLPSQYEGAQGFQLRYTEIRSDSNNSETAVNILCSQNTTASLSYIGEFPERSYHFELYIPLAFCDVDALCHNGSICGNYATCTKKSQNEYRCDCWEGHDSVNGICQATSNIQTTDVYYYAATMLKGSTTVSTVSLDSSTSSTISTPSPAFGSGASNSSNVRKTIAVVVPILALVVAAVTATIYVMRNRSLRRYMKQNNEVELMQISSASPNEAIKANNDIDKPISISNITNIYTNTNIVFNNIIYNNSSNSGNNNNNSNYNNNNNSTSVQYLTDTLNNFKRSEPVPILQYSDITFEAKLGSGSSAKVYKGLYGGGTVAVKVLKYDVNDIELDKKERQTRFCKEFKIMQAVNTPHSVFFYGAILEPKLCIVMEYCELGSLYHVLKKTKYDIGWQQVFHFATESTKAINELHNFDPQILHRDIKSLNFLVSANFDLKVCDYGLSRFNTDSNLSTLQHFRGTLAYCAPEVYNSGLYSVKSDVYSIGILLWELVTRCIRGKHEKPYAEFQEIMFDLQIIIQAASGLRPTIPETCPEGWKQLILSCIDGRTEKRPNCDEILSTLNNLHLEYVSNKTSWDATIMPKNPLSN